MAGGRPVAALLALIDEHLGKDNEVPHGLQLRAALQRLQEATGWIAAHGLEDPEQAGMAATPFLRLMALTVVA